MANVVETEGQEYKKDIQPMCNPELEKGRYGFEIRPYLRKDCVLVGRYDRVKSAQQ